MTITVSAVAVSMSWLGWTAERRMTSSAAIAARSPRRRAGRAAGPRRCRTVSGVRSWEPSPRIPLLAGAGPWCEIRGAPQRRERTVSEPTSWNTWSSETSSTSSRIAVALIQRSASCSFWPSGCAAASQVARSSAQIDISVVDDRPERAPLELLISRRNMPQGFSRPGRAHLVGIDHMIADPS